MSRRYRDAACHTGSATTVQPSLRSALTWSCWVCSPAVRADDPDTEDWDATFDASVDAAVRAFQQQRGLIADGVVGLSTWRRLDGARWGLGDRVLRYGTRHMQNGDDVTALQQRLFDLGFDPGRIDGVFGPDTEHGLKELQRNLGIPSDGLCGPVTFRALERLSRTVVGGEPATDP